MATHSLYLVSVWLHLTAMAVWMGGMVFLAAVVLPGLRQHGPAAVGEFLAQATPRLRVVGWTCLLVLGVTGWYQLAYRGVAWSSDALVLSKLAIYFTIVAISLAHDFWLGPRASAALRDAPDAPATARLRREAMLMGRVTALLALLAVTLGVLIARGVPW